MDADSGARVSVQHRAREHVLRDGIEAFRGYVYGREKKKGESKGGIGYPWRIPGLSGMPLVSRGAPRATNCCHFAECLLAHAFPHAIWTHTRHLAMMIRDGDRFGPITAADVLEIGTPTTKIAGDWRLVQGWKKNGYGHTFIIVRTDDDGSMLIVEGNQAHGVSGVGFRDVADLDALDEQWDFDRLPTSGMWNEKRLASYYSAGMKAVALNVVR